MSALFTNSLSMWAEVREIVPRTHDVVTVVLARPSGFSYQAGQYITVFFDDTDISEGKAYSLSSHPSDGECISITVKRVGLFSGKLHGLQAGDQLRISQAYGMFNAFGSAPLVALAAGVGIAPIYSIVCEEAARQTNRQIQIVYSNATEQDIIFRDELAKLTRALPGLSVRHVVTRQPRSPLSGLRINGSEIANEHPGSTFCLCGTVDFVRDVRRQLAESGASDDDIVSEVFFEAR